jgi:UV radiation resistance-associated gene protein
MTQNRRLRHLQGISVRNLNVVSTPGHRRRKTTTDEDVAYTLKPPSKLLAQNEATSLHQTRSFTNLKSPRQGDELFVQKRPSSHHHKSAQANGRPNFGKIRRRSTLHWTGATPETRQRKLEEVARERMAEAWFSLHATDLPEPVYVSEVMEKSLNPTFQFFDLNINGPRVARANEVQLKLWAKTDKLETFILLIELEICLNSLQFIGKSLDNFHQPLPSNCILFHFEDGIYTSFTDMSNEEHPIVALSGGSAKAGVAKPDQTSSYNALMQLANVDDCIQDALATRADLEEQINVLLFYNKQKLETLEKKRQAEEAASAVRRATSSEQRQLRSLSRKKEDILTSLKLRKEAIQSGRSIQGQNECAKKDLQRAIQETRSHLRQTLDDTSGQVRRVCEDLALIYPLEPIKNRPLHFSIRHLYLPNSIFDDTNRDEIAAALSFTSKLTHMLSLYLSTPLPYPISSDSSTSTIEDPISIAITQRTYPLYPTNVAYKFEYGVFLLNKDIEFLMNKNGLRILDIRHTLPNLKYLLYVLTAGTGELPARKAGGIRGLVSGRVTPTISRRGSEDSAHSSAGFNVKLLDGQTRHGRLSPMQVNGKEKAESDMSARLIPSPSGKAHAYRNTSLREAF